MIQFHQFPMQTMEYYYQKSQILINLKTTFCFLDTLVHKEKSYLK